MAQKLPLQKLGSQELAIAAWSAARLRLQLGGLKDAMQEAGVAELDARDIAKTAWALARLRWDEQPLLTRLVSTAAHVREELEPQGLANTLWAFATLKVAKRQAMHLVPGIVRCQEQFCP